ncbi:DUF2334 domain-containing protein [Rariglobus hedericola]|uniref:Polysaccharide deacetylase n=1 Tax=Rariglobus hedericola TaxID=2597822 RepID=A0A556QRQ5_9BACT|nr:DUF2334 domain-containing protein [Rariglobus hedericola]TSJ79318.1 polysaccharide deacetylase [Rariglobus hedericola]
MISRLRPFVLAAFACSGVAAFAVPEARLPAPLIPVVLKVDDLSVRGNGAASARWKRITDFALERKFKLSIGIIANSLEGDKPAYSAYLKNLQKSGLIEFWFHGYDHGVHKDGEPGKDYAEFANRPYEEQKRRFEISQKLAVEKLGAPFTCFGPPGGGNTQASDADWEATTRVMAQDPAMKLWLYPKALDERGAKLQSAGKVTILDRVYQVNIEQPLFVPNPEKFIEAYAKHAPGRRYFILQGHPDQWDDARWAAFVKLIDYLQTNHIPILTPSELVASLSTPVS